MKILRAYWALGRFLGKRASQASASDHFSRRWPFGEVLGVENKSFARQYGWLNKPPVYSCTLRWPRQFQQIALGMPILGFL